jgi:3-hydroxyisobutyrate dehydrogenase-like beta-hydroxyacid dehydrogenase
VAQAEQIANELGVDTATLASVIQQSSGSSFVMGLVANMGSSTALVDAAGHYMRKDIDVVRQVAAGLGIDLGVLGEAVDGGPADFRPR